jgi:hypothetical protein
MVVSFQSEDETRRKCLLEAMVLYWSLFLSMVITQMRNWQTRTLTFYVITSCHMICGVALIARKSFLQLRIITNNFLHIVVMSLLVFGQPSSKKSVEICC